MRPSHIIVLIVILLLIFGASKLPDIAKSFGQSAKVLKKEMRELQDDVPPQGAQQTEGVQPPNPAQQYGQPQYGPGQAAPPPYNQQQYGPPPSVPQQPVDPQAWNQPSGNGQGPDEGTVPADRTDQQP